jgi:hypothetical protein
MNLYTDDVKANSIYLKKKYPKFHVKKNIKENFFYLRGGGGPTSLKKRERKKGNNPLTRTFKINLFLCCVCL